MRKWLLACLGGLVVAAVVGTAVYMVSYEPTPPPAGHPDAPATVTVERTDLSTSVELNGSLGYGVATTFTGRNEGTVTWLPSVGDVIQQGQRLYGVDADPVVLFIGDLPLYRTIDEDSEPGPDIAEVNANLRDLGYRTAPRGNRYTAGTKIALKRWQRDNNLDVTGTLAVGDVAMLPGAVRVDSLMVQPGVQAKTKLMTLTSTTKRVTVGVKRNKVDTSLLQKG